MVFSSIVFLTFFFPIVLILYYISPSLKVKNGLLVTASLLFYALGEPTYIFLLLFSSIVNYFFAIIIDQRKNEKLYLVLSVIFNLSQLFIFKYLSAILGLFGMSNLQIINHLPVGISFYTFQVLSYVVDVYRKEVKAQSNYWNVLLYISFFPQLIAGPIVKYHDVAEQIKHRKHSFLLVSQGIRRFIFGLAKKVLLSNTIAYIVDQIFQLPYSGLNIITAWTGAILYCLQIYYDFSGYSDMAIGLGKIFGFHFNENFNYPYTSTSIQEFWRRWHISLSSWFKEYLYIPLGGNRISKNRTILNKLIVFFCTGLWHGANFTFIIWGLLNGLFSSLETKGIWAKRLKGTFIGWLYTMIVVSFCFVLFRSSDLIQAFYFCKNMLTGFQITHHSMALLLQYFDHYTIFIILIACIGIWNWKDRFSKKMEVISYPISLFLLILCIMSLGANGYNPFIYYQF